MLDSRHWGVTVSWEGDRMRNRGDSFIVTLRNFHLNWGEDRYTHSRDRIPGEGYIPIPSNKARDFNIYNSNHIPTGLGYNEFNATSTDGFFEDVLKSSGCSKAGDIYAKNLHGSGNLKALDDWFHHLDFIPGDQVEVRWISPTELTLEKL